MLLSSSVSLCVLWNRSKKHYYLNGMKAEIFSRGAVCICISSNYMMRELLIIRFWMKHFHFTSLESNIENVSFPCRHDTHPSSISCVLHFYVVLVSRPESVMRHFLDVVNSHFELSLSKWTFLLEHLLLKAFDLPPFRSGESVGGRTPEQTEPANQVLSLHGDGSELSLSLPGGNFLRRRLLSPKPQMPWSSAWQPSECELLRIVSYPLSRWLGRARAWSH